MGEACRIAVDENREKCKKNASIKKRIIKALKGAGVKYVINGEQQYCVNNTVNITLPGVSSEALMMLTKSNCALSNGSACTSKKYEPSHVLMGMGLTKDMAESSIRVSWDYDIEEELLIKEFNAVLVSAKNLIG